MTGPMIEVIELAQEVFEFDLQDVHSENGFYEIVAMGLLVYPRVSFVPILGFEELDVMDLGVVVLRE